MKTPTRNQILKIIEQAGKSSPAQLSDRLKITTQAIHRHLRALVAQGILETRGSAPYTQYALAGIPDFEMAFAWASASAAEENDQVNETRDALSARLPKLKSALSAGLDVTALPLVISTCGEIGNNSFDHNLGNWRDVPGCWFETQITGDVLWICFADRGQGIFRSLSRVQPDITDDRSALEIAFEKIVSGRAPERRGNGLKFVRSNIATAPGRGIACASGSGIIHYGERGPECGKILRRKFSKVKGTVTLIAWGLK